MTEKRLHERFPRRLRVRIVHENSEFEAVTRDLGLGGMFVVAASAPPYGAELGLTLPLPEVSVELQVRGVVRWVTDDGFGVQFVNLRARDVWALNQLFRGNRA